MIKNDPVLTQQGDDILYACGIFDYPGKDHTTGGERKKKDVGLVSGQLSFGRLGALTPKAQKANGKWQMSTCMVHTGVYRLTPRNACYELRIWHGAFCFSLFLCCSEAHISGS